MRKSGLAGFAPAAVLAVAAIGAATPARAAPFYVVRTTDEIAGAIDLGSRQRIGEVVRVNLHLLRRQPVSAGQFQAHWADGVQEVDCAGHRSRLILTTLLSQDRGRSAPEPGAAFGPWSANAPGSNAASLEDFVCGNQVRAPIRQIADLSTLRSQFFSGEAQLADRGERAIADVRAAVERERANPPKPPPTPAPRPVAPSPPTGAVPRYLVTSYTKGSAFIVDRAQIHRNGSIVSSVNYLLSAKPSRSAGVETYWSEAVKEHDCAQHRVRMNLIGSMTLDLKQRVGMPPGSTFEPWEPVTPNSTESEVEALVCTGKLGRSMSASAEDLGQLQRAFFAFAAGPESRFAFGPAAAASALRSIAPRPPPFVVTSYGKTSAEVINRGNLLREGSVVSAEAWILLAEPTKNRGVDYPWTERIMEVDCAKHLHRRAMVSIYTAGLGDRVAMPRVEFNAWSANDSAMEAGNEGLLCNGGLTPGMIELDSLASLERSYFAYARSTAQVLTLGSIAPSPTPKAAQNDDKPLDLVMIAVNPGGATIANRASLMRSGDIVTIAVITLTRQPVRKGAFDLYWTETDHQMDCAGHRRRTKTTYMHTLAMDHQEPITGPYTDWTPIAADAQPLESFTCRGVMPATFREVAGLQSFQRTFFERGPTAFGAPSSPATRATAAPAPPPPSAAPARKTDYVMVDVGDHGATLMDRASIRRTGELVTFSQLALLSKPEVLRGRDFWWYEGVEQIDCMGHRERFRLDALLTLDRRQREPDPKPAYGDWASNKKGTVAASIEAFACLAKGDYEPVTDLDGFQRDVAKAIKEGVFK